MKISQINGLGTKFSPIYSKKEEGNNKIFHTNPELKSNQHIDSEVLKNYYINFKAGKSVQKFNTNNEKMRTLEGLMSSQAKELLESARSIAKKYGYKAINQTLIVLAGLLGVKNYIEKLDNGEIDVDDASKHYIPLIIEEETTEDVFKDKEKRNIISKAIDSQITNLTKIIDESKPAKATSSKSKIIFTPEFINDIVSRFNIEVTNGNITDNFIHDATIFMSALDNHKDNFQKNVVTPFRMAIKELWQEYKSRKKAFFEKLNEDQAFCDKLNKIIIENIEGEKK